MMLKILPTLDSPELAAARRRELDVPRDIAKQMAQVELQAAAEGSYLHEAKRVNWADEIHAACNAKVSIRGDAALPAIEPTRLVETQVQVTNETTLGAARRLTNPLALNFANGVHPGGGFLNGARAQEEALCRVSALYQTLLGDPMYAAHAQRPAQDSSDWAIYSPNVPVFRNDDGATLPKPWPLSFLTCAAPYAPTVGRELSAELLARRIHRVLHIARAYQHSSLVLGAWGCGAFANDPERTARDFRSALEGPFRGVFAHVVFAVADWSEERRFLGPFARVFSA
jgi:uncharacterized protein (TIGR02452 family)